MSIILIILTLSQGQDLSQDKIFFLITSEIQLGFLEHIIGSSA